MSRKHRGGPAPVPPANRPGHNPGKTPSNIPASQNTPDKTPDPEEVGGAPFQEQDPKRRLGNFSGTGEHPIQQPGPLNDGDRHNK